MTIKELKEKFYGIWSEAMTQFHANKRRERGAANNKKDQEFWRSVSDDNWQLAEYTLQIAANVLNIAYFDIWQEFDNRRNLETYNN